MIDLKVKVISYDKKLNTCKANLSSGEIIDLDPFVGCAIPMTDEEYKNDKGFLTVGNDYVLTEYSVYKHNVVPHEGGMKLI